MRCLLNKVSAFLLVGSLLTLGCTQPPYHTARGHEAAFLQSLVQATVMVVTERGMGSGTIVYSDSKHVLVLTCNHVIDGAGSAYIQSPFIGEHAATVEKIDVPGDLALLSAEVPKRAATLHVAAREASLYERLYLIGSPLAAYGSVSEGWVISKSDVDEDGVTRWLVSGGFVVWGISGGTGVNAQGELECVPEAVRMEHGQAFPQMGVCVGLDTIKRFLKGYSV